LVLTIELDGNAKKMDSTTEIHYLTTWFDTNG
jgi:hypothetical protein